MRPLRVIDHPDHCPFEPPINTEIVVDTKAEKVSESVHKILVAIGEKTIHE